MLRHRILRTIIAIFTIGTILALSPNYAQEQDPLDQFDPLNIGFIALLFEEGPSLEERFKYIEANWQPGFSVMALEVMMLSRSQYVQNRLVRMLRKTTGQTHLGAIDDWFQWLWNQPEQPYVHYGEFKSLLYRMIDPKFAEYFSAGRPSKIRLDEVRWGGVGQDGIPPLRSPKMIPADQADYLKDDHVVFGIEINGDARAYPQRILAWHEMFVDTVGGIDFAGVYCTLCGAVILYETTQEETAYEMGTSGFLYRSNKLMYDKATQSLWNTTWGRPVIGPLVGQSIELKRSYVVTTNWGEWKRRHPDTTVLSLDTGHKRNYDEGVAYSDYFATNQLMFTVPKTDSRLNNKDEILALTFPDKGKETAAIHANYLLENPVYHDNVASQELVVFTDPSGANRVYQSGGITFSSFDGNRTIIDNQQQIWHLTEDAITAEDGTKLSRLPAHRAFWFGWFAANPDTRLVFQSN
ncbi:MAG: DUF3179 domain-containing protein [Gammaproteobacteria bacterium]|nr:DUF3179 domain-containing protein [Gammaproteobacteria bacterium]